MEHDELYSADNFSGSDIDEDRIDSDLEDKLYAAVFHSNDISSKNQEVPGYNNFTTLTDVIGAWKTVLDENEKLLNTEKVASGDTNPPPYPWKKSEENISRYKFCAQVSESLKPSDERIDHRKKYPCEKITEELSRHGNSVEYTGSFGPCDVVGDKENGINIYGEKEVGFGMEMTRGRSGLQDELRDAFGEVERRCPQTKIAKKHKHSPSKLTKSKDSRVDKSPLKSHRRNDTNEDSNIRVQDYSRNNPESASAPEDAAESSDVKAKERINKDESADKERRISSAGNEPCGVEELSDIKPEEEFKEARSAGQKAVEEASEEVKPEEEKQIEKVASMETEVSRALSDSSSSDSSWVDNSSNIFQHDTRDVDKGAEEDEKSLATGTECEEIITLDDSEGSICEIPVPPKPSPPTINLEDSESSSSSSDSDTTTEIMTPEKLVESYRIAVSKSKSRNQEAGRAGKSTAGNNRARSRGSCNFSSESDDSMTESEEENWGIIAGSQINKDKPAASSSRRVTMSEIIGNLTTEIDQQDSNCPIIEIGDESTDLVSEEQENSIRESQRELLTGDSEIMKKTHGNLTPNKSIDVEPQLDESEILSPTQQTSVENNDKEKYPGEDQNVAKDDSLIINAEGAGSLTDFGESREPGTSTRSPENRKRPITDSGKKSKHQISPKKAKSSDDSGAAGSSSNKSRRENKENREKRRNFAVDYFFTPMNNEMENYYNESWGGETFDIDTIQRQMPRDQRHWAVLNEDLLGYQQRRSRYWTESKCRNCNHTGHRMAECPEKKKAVSCHMCGASGHKEPRCPHKMCLGCGKKQKTYMQVCNGCQKARCNACQSYGHVEDSCPDLWRRYHITTRQGDLNTQLSMVDVMKPQRLLSCCNCARRGHDSTTCNNYRWSRHFPTPAYVTNYNMGPSYAEDPVLEDVGFPSETGDQTDEEKRQTVSSETRRSLSSNVRKRRKSNADKVMIENPEVNGEYSQSRSKDVDKNVEKVGEQLQNDQSESNEDKIEKSNELSPKNSNGTKNEEILLTLKSQLLNDKFMRAPNYSEYIFPLSVEQLKGLVESDVSRQFLMNLTSQFPVKLEIKRSLDNGATVMTIATTRDLHFPMQLTVMDWLKWPNDERSRFVNLNLSMNKEELVKLLSTKLEELTQNLGDPFKLHSQIQLLKRKLQSLQRQSRAGKKMSTCSKRAHIVEVLAKAQCKMNMILFGQVKLRKSEKSCKFLRGVLKEMQKPRSPSYICPATYLQIVRHYNIIFAAYTPDNLSNLLDLYWNKYCGKYVPPKKRKLLYRDTEAVYANFSKALNEMNKQRNTSSSLDGPNQITSEFIDLEGGGGSSAFIRSKNCNGFENQYVIPETNLNNANLNLNSNLSLAQFPIIYGLDKVENNYYNSQYDFRNNSNFQGHRDTVQTNRQEDDYIALNNRDLKNDRYNREKDFNIGGGDYNRKSRGRYMEKIMPRNRVNETVENGFENHHGDNIRSNSSTERNRWQESFAQRNLSSQDMFFSDTRADLSQNFPHNDTSDVFSRNEIERRSRYNENGPSTSGTHNQLRIQSYRNHGPGPEQRKTGNKEKKKKKKNRNASLPNVQKRAEKSITKYMDLKIPRVTQAVKELQKKLTNNNITLRCVKKFEALVKRKLKVTDHLL